MASASELFRTSKSTFEWVDKPEFDQMCDDKEWESEPRIDSFGDGYGEPYNPNRAIFGILKEGRRVYTNTKNDKTLE